MCVNATVENETVTYSLTSMTHELEEVGWIALGFGEAMVHSPMVIMWKNDDGSMTLSQRITRFYTEPTVVPDPSRIATSVEPKLTAIPAHQSLLNGTSMRETLIWALSPLRPDKAPESHIARHFEIGHINLHFKNVEMAEDHSTSTAVPSPSPTAGNSPSEEDEHEHGHDHDHGGHEKTVHAHAFFVSFGFLFLLPLGVLAGRWGRTISPVWFKVHWIINMALAGPIIALGWVLGPISVYQAGVPHLNDAHKICGVIFIFLYAAQVLLGRFIHRRRVESTAPITKPHPPLNILHVVIGLLLIAFAFFQVRSGLDKLAQEEDEAPSVKWYYKVWAIWAAIIPFLYLAGLSLLPRQFRQERANAGASDSTYAPLSDDIQLAESSTRLLFENPDDDDGDVEDPKYKK
ncbi:hypothetical protein EST38_g1673 [Candolleomyces aberdarensis]|uniref:Cytochrome b561 domain-containing protein n=1 Tax=Candolleomyces aberdarensis TaxID=2316362 RepID=A0A4Q2DVG2_9AGAR|nr:hypothetical protein EST38_g1673 [Candolleomyces aberdarensis]